MRNMLAFAIVALITAGVVPRLYVGTNGAAANHRAAPPAPSRATQASASVANYGSAMILRRSDDGHFHAAVDVEGRRMDFLVDTGASTIALRESDAAWIGIRPAQREYTARVNTANGVVRGAPVRLNRVELGSLSVHDVLAIILPDEALGQNLLGMSFLSHVRWEHRDGQLVLEQ
jgi:aspartyl protease family protein